MKVHLIASAYMSDQDMPCLIVSCKTYDELMKNPEPLDPIFYGLGETAQEAHETIYESFGLKLKTKEEGEL